jgi:hypothetical protein
LRLPLVKKARVEKLQTTTHGSVGGTWATATATTLAIASARAAAMLVQRISESKDGIFSTPIKTFSFFFVIAQGARRSCRRN